MDNKKIKAFFRNDRFADLAGIEIVETRGGYCKA
jgi:hypothetical protein